jgi:hypothetical protein
MSKMLALAAIAREVAADLGLDPSDVIDAEDDQPIEDEIDDPEE